jgi:hypothetical protein
VKCNNEKIFEKVKPHTAGKNQTFFFEIPQIVNTNYGVLDLVAIGAPIYMYKYTKNRNSLDGSAWAGKFFEFFCILFEKKENGAKFIKKLKKHIKKS